LATTLNLLDWQNDFLNTMSWKMVAKLAYKKAKKN
jgi:hypothetical protein